MSLTSSVALCGPASAHALDPLRTPWTSLPWAKSKGAERLLTCRG